LSFSEHLADAGRSGEGHASLSPEKEADKEPHGSAVKSVQAVERSLSILEALGEAGNSLLLTEICRKTGLNMTTAYRLLHTMVRREFVRRDPVTGRYQLTLKLYRIANAALYAFDWREYAHSVLEELVSICNETANIVVLDNFDIVYIDQVESTRMVKMMARMGRHLPAYCTGGGKALLAYLPEEKLLRLLKSHQLKAYTQNTITDPGRFLEEMRKIRRNGYSLDMEEREEGVRCVAAPIFNMAGEAIAALSVSGPSNRLTQDYLNSRIIPLVKEYAAKITQRLGYNPSLVGGARK